MPLSQQIQDQIRKDANDYAKIVVKGPTQWDDENTSKKTGYIAGATAEAEKALCLIEALEKIANDEGESCRRCEGNGKLWADGKAHYSTHTGATVNCGECGGSGKIFPDGKDIATASLQSYTNSLK